MHSVHKIHLPTTPNFETDYFLPETYNYKGL